MQNSPILTRADGRELVIDGGKAGVLVAVDAQTGKLVWKRAVGLHNGHDHDDLLAEHGHSSKLKLPETILPGPLGGIESAIASNGRTVFAAVNNLPGLVSASGITVTTVFGTGDLVAVNEATGKVEWQVPLPVSPYAGVTLANNVVFTTTYNGDVWGFNASTGKLLWLAELPNWTNAPVAVDGDTLLTATSFENVTIERVYAFRLGAKDKLPGLHGSGGLRG
jgi:outer membrane protein assembly factor BamB